MKKTFTLSQSAAKRVAKAVKIVEAENRDELPVALRTNSAASLGKSIAIGFCEGPDDWPIGATKTIKVYETKTRSKDADDIRLEQATNLFYDLSFENDIDCAFAKYLGNWYLIASECGD